MPVVNKADDSEREREQKNTKHFNVKLYACILVRLRITQRQIIYDLFDKLLMMDKSHIVISALKSVRNSFVDRLRA